jgi:hypothetical protein
MCNAYNHPPAIAFPPDPFDLDHRVPQRWLDGISLRTFDPLDRKDFGSQ